MITYTTLPVGAPSPPYDSMPEFGRTEDVRRYFGIKRGTLYNLHKERQIKGHVLRRNGNIKGIRLWNMQSIRDYIYSNVEKEAAWLAIYAHQHL